MNKETFLKALRERLSAFPQDDIEERISFYEEMLDDRMEEGMTEEEAVRSAGSVDEIAKQVMSEIPLSRLVSEKVRPKRRLKAWEIVLLVLGSPVWVPLIAAAAAVLVSIYAVLWSIVVSVYAVAVSFAASAVVSVPAAIRYLLSGNPAGACFLLGAGLVLAGLSILVFIAGAALTKWVVKLTKSFALWVKSLFVGKEETKNAYA